MQLSKKSDFNFYEQIIINSIDLENYDLPMSKNNLKNINQVYEIFKKEYLFPANLKRYGSEQNCFKEWIQGLPSVLTVPFYNNEILELAKNYFTVDRFCRSTYNRNQNQFLENYFANLSNSFFTLKNSL